MKYWVFFLIRLNQAILYQSKIDLIKFCFSSLEPYCFTVDRVSLTDLFERPLLYYLWLKRQVSLLYQIKKWDQNKKDLEISFFCFTSLIPLLNEGTIQLRLVMKYALTCNWRLCLCFCIDCIKVLLSFYEFQWFKT